MDTKFLLTAIIAVILLTIPKSDWSSPMYGGDKPNVAKELPSREKEVKLNYGTAECVRTAYIGDINNRILICVEYRYKKESK
jgi:hypothetical protein